MRDPTARNRQIFMLILEDISSLYRIYTRSGKKIGTGTISKVIKSLKKNGYIRTYQPENQEKRGKLERDLWGPTIWGIIEICIFEKNVLKQLGTLYDHWLHHSEFLEELKLHGFDIKLVHKKPKKAKEIFQKYIQLCVDRRKQIIDFLNNPEKYDLITRDNIGESLLVQRNPEYKKIIFELYKYMPGVQQTVNALFKGFGLEYRTLKKQTKTEPK